MKSILDRIRQKVHIIDTPLEEEHLSGEEIVSDITRLIVCRNLVPVICEDMFEYINPITNEKQPLQSYIVEYILTNHPNNVCYTEKELWEILNNGYYGLSQLHNKYGYKFYEYVNKAILDDNNKIKEGIQLKTEVKEFLCKGQFPLIVTTSCFRIIENAIDGYSSYFYDPNSINDTVLNCRCVYHLFGESKPNRPECGIDDRQILKYLCKLYSTDYAPKNLASYISNNHDRRTLMFLGNNTPDWLFRFMLPPMYPIDLYSEVGKGFYIKSHERKTDAHLKSFLRDIKFETEDNLLNVIKQITLKLSTRSNIQGGHNKKYDFFISHASEDNQYARELKNILESHGLKVWYDEIDIIDGPYWQRIIDGIEQSAIFMPLVSSAYIKKKKKKKERVRLLNKYGYKVVPHDKEICLKLNKDSEIGMSGVQIELLLAESQYVNQDVPSIPVVLSDEIIELLYDDYTITPELVEKMADDSKIFPEKLFQGIQMYKFKKNNPLGFVLDWNRYKGNG